MLTPAILHVNRSMPHTPKKVRHTQQRLSAEEEVSRRAGELRRIIHTSGEKCDAWGILTSKRRGSSVGKIGVVGN